MKIGILLSGRGSNFEAIARSVASGFIPAEISTVISNREEAPGLARARALGFNARFIASRNRTRQSFDHQLAAALKASGADCVCLAGFMRVLSPEFVGQFPGKILNIHPSLLPAFPGVDAQKQALQYGVKFTGCTVHLVNETVDAGPIVLQAVVPVFEDDGVESLSARILDQEHRIYPEAVRLLVEGRLRIEGRR
ncbi:MAG: phosphoribosylglycinamide formyltransferase, partial [Terriglobia bacterium]